jgi:hypothetical protein
MCRWLLESEPPQRQTNRTGRRAYGVVSRGGSGEVWPMALSVTGHAE